MSFKFDMKDFSKKLEKRLRDNKVKTLVTRGTLMVEGSAKKSILKGGTGKLYEKYNPRRTHRASAPKEPPASDTGFLVSQISMNVKEEANGVIVGQVISAAPYSAHLEFGTTNMTERPFMQPALEKNRRKIERLFTAGILK
tara:strand:+ start:183 stop:605 length:423 start_codon:yes stop_codon:yes gene_type:complete